MLLEGIIDLWTLDSSFMGFHALFDPLITEKCECFSLDLAAMLCCGRAGAYIMSALATLDVVRIPTIEKTWSNNLVTFHRIAAEWEQDLPGPATHVHPAVLTSPASVTSTQALCHALFKHWLGSTFAFK